MASLYVTTPGTRLELEAGQLVCVLRQEVILAVPVARVTQVVLLGGCHVTTPVLQHLLDQNIDTVFLTAGGSFRGRLDTGMQGHVIRRRIQYQCAADQDFCLQLARTFVRGKLQNRRTRCMELDKDGEDSSIRAIEELKQAMNAVENATSIAELTGIEGRGTRWYFSVLRNHLREPWSFSSRVRRPAPDPVNALLSLAYTLLHENCRSILYAVGLDPDYGFLHRPRAGHAALASDLMEEFRPVIADSVVWMLLNKQMLKPSNFTRGVGGGVRLTPDGWRVFATQFNRRMETHIRKQGRTTRTTYRKLLEVQAWQIVRVTEGARDKYVPFRSR